MDNYFDTNEFKEVLRHYEDFRDNGVACYFDADELTDIAEYYYTKGENKLAFDAIEYAIRVFPGSSVAVSYLARLTLSKDNNPQEARKILEQADDKNCLEYVLADADILIVENRQEEAQQKLWNYYQETKSYDRESDRLDFCLDAAILFISHDDTDYGELWLKEAGPSEDADYRYYTALLAKLRGNLEEAKTILNQLLDEDPFSVGYWCSLAEIQMVLEEYNNSITSCDYVLAINPLNESALYTKSRALYTLGNYEQALVIQKQLCEICPDDEIAFMVLGLIYDQLFQQDQALKNLEKAYEISNKKAGKPFLDQILFELISNEQDHGHIDKALAYIEELKEYVLTHDSIEYMNGIKPEIYLPIMSGGLLLQNGEKDKAYDYFARAISLSDKSPLVISEAAITSFRCGDVRLAHQLFRFLESTTEDVWPQGYAYYARCCLEFKQLNDFRNYATLAAKYMPEEAELVLSDLFPPHTPIEEYTNLIIE